MINCELFETLCLAKSNDKEALMKILKKFNPMIKKLARNLPYDEAESDLIIHLIELVCKFDLNTPYKNNQGAFVNYISNSLRNKSIDLFKNHISKHHVEFELNLDIAHSQDLSENIINKLFIHQLLNSNCLSDKQKIVLTEKYLKDNPESEIATNLNISRQAVNRLKISGLSNNRNYLKIKI